MQKKIQNERKVEKEEEGEENITAWRASEGLP